MPRLTLHLFGPPRLELDGVQVETDRRKALALLAYLAVTRQSHTREALAALFWPEREPSRAYAYLRRALWEVNQAVGEGWVLADRETVSLNPDADWRLDVAQFQELLARRREAGGNCAACLPLLTEAAALYQDHFLSGFGLKDAPGFDEWAFFQAESLRRDLAQALERLVRCQLEQRRADDAIPFARRWLALDPLNEAAHLQLMLVYEQAGQHNAALRQYQECARLLREELGAEPQPETTALYERLRKEETRMTRGESALPRPTGTVTFLFTDIEGSTHLWEQYPEWMPRAFARHEAILREAVAAHGGYAYKMIGDAFQVAFATAPAALAAACAAQRALHAEAWGETPLRVRMALHTGVAEERGDDYVGPVLNRVARLITAAHGGQVLLTQVTYDLAHDHLPAGAGGRDLGAHRLKDLIRPEHIYQLVASDLPADFPALRTLDTFPHNLPLQLTSFIGREKEIADVKRLLIGARLATLTGPGGIGKSRLSLQVAAELLELFPDGVWLVELAPLADPALVAQTVTTALGVREAPGRPILTILTEYLRTKNLLLLLDNCEHLVEACARLAEALLQACPHLWILTSSREPLGIAGEAPYRVPSLSIPDIRHLPPVETLTQYEAVRLFLERAEVAMPGFVVTNANAPAIAQVCHRLDGIPLAIELAVARVKLLGVEQVAARLDDRFRLLTGGSRTALPRHQTLRALIDWSYDLLSPPERGLLQRLSVFAGGWRLEAVEAVTSHQSSVISDQWSLVTDHILDLLTQLVNKSLVVADGEQGAETRYRLLETIRQYAREKLLEAGSAVAEQAHHQHLEYFLRLGEQAEPELRGPDQAAWLDRLEAELDNLRAALEWSLETNVATGLRLAAALLWFWHIRGHKAEGCEWLERALSAEAQECGDHALPVAHAMIRGKALNVAGFLRRMLGETDKAAMLTEKSVALFRELGPAGKRGLAYALLNLGTIDQDLDRAKALAEESLSLFREVGDQLGIAESLNTLGGIAWGKGDFPRARVIWEERLALCRELGDKDGIAHSLTELGDVTFRQGDYQQATTLYEDSLARFREIGNKWMMGEVLSRLGQVASAQGDYEQAAQRYEAALRLERDIGDKFAVAGTYYRMGLAAWSQGDDQQATRMLEDALALVREVGNKDATAGTLHRLGTLALAQGDYEQAVKCYAEALAVGQDVGSKFLITLALCSLGQVAWAQGDNEQAAQRLEEAMSVSQEARSLPVSLTLYVSGTPALPTTTTPARSLPVSLTLYVLGRVAYSQGDYASAHSRFVESISLSQELGQRGGVACNLEALAALAAAHDQMQPSPLRFEGLRRAARLCGAADALHDLSRFSLSPAERVERDRALAAARAALGEEAFAAVYAEGQAMTMEQAVEYALGGEPRSAE
ncbi:MAG TPA: tetratricopeptide repeat protein [Anaerolineales bacterium]|nr:tetratricopeptide repeat protein [Anaerolineales bacterium]